jgi:hypothetical protein
MTKPTMTQAVMERWAAITPTLPTLYLEEIPEDKPQLEGAYYLHQGEPPTPAAYPTRALKPVMLEGRFAFVLFNVSAVALETKAFQIMGGFTVDSLAMNSPQETTLFRTNYQLQATKFRDRNDLVVYAATISYRLLIGKPSC